MADPAEVHRRSPVPHFGPNEPFQNIPAFQSQQDSTVIPAQQTFHPYSEADTQLYNHTSRLPVYYGQPQPFIDTVPTVDPHVLHQASSLRHNSWDSSAAESNYDDAWSSTVRDQSCRHQMNY